MQNFKHDLLVRDRVHQSVGAQQQKIPRLPLYGKVVCLYGGVRAQSPGNEIAAGMAAGLAGSQVTLSTMSSTREWSRLICRRP